MNLTAILSTTHQSKHKRKLLHRLLSRTKRFGAACCHTTLDHTLVGGMTPADCIQDTSLTETQMRVGTRCSSSSREHCHCGCPDKPHLHHKQGPRLYWLSSLESQATIFTLPTCSVVSSFLNCASVKMKVHTLSQNLYVCRWPWKYMRAGISNRTKVAVHTSTMTNMPNEEKPWTKLELCAFCGKQAVSHARKHHRNL